MANNVTVDGDLLLTDPPMLDSTGKIIAYEQQKQTALLGILADQAPRAALLADWQQAASAIKGGLGEYVFPTGSAVVIPWKDKASSSANEASYNARFDVMHHGQGALVSGEALKVVHLQMHHVLPFDTQFSPYQAFLYAIDGLPAGTYNVTFASDAGDASTKGKTFQFTLTQAVPAGGQLCGFESYTGRSIKVYASQTATTAQETVTATEGSSGTSLGTITVAGVSVPASGTPASTNSVTIGGTAYTYYGLNAVQRIAYGNNRWLHSPLRQYLNAEGFDWWVPKTVFDRPPAYAARRGYMSGLPEQFLEQVQPIARQTALNYVTDGGTSGSPLYDTTYDLFTLPSGIEHNLQDTAGYGGAQGKEGVAWDYWKRVANSSSPLGWSTWGNESTYHPEYVQYDLAAQTTARAAWMRSATRGSGGTVTCVSSAGSCNDYGAVGGVRAAAACAIG